MVVRFLMVVVALVGITATSSLNAAVTRVVDFWSGQTEYDKATRFHWFEPHTLGAHDPTGHFGDAQSGPMGEVRWDNPNGWGQLPTYKAALPVYTWEYLTDWSLPFDGSWGSSSLFAVPFFVPNNYVSHASLELEYSIDNYLGGESGGNTFEGIFINGNPIVGTRTVSPGDQRFLQNESLIIPDSVALGEMLWPSQINWIYFNVSDTYPQAGMMVGGRFQITSNPEPASVVAWLLLAGIGCFVGYRKGVFTRRH